MEKKGFIIDTMNYCKYMIDFNDYMNLRQPLKIIEFFKKFDKGELIFVIDGGKRSLAEIAKYRRRKVGGFTSKAPFPIPASSSILFYLLKEAGFKVCFSGSHDCDDSIARMANDTGYDVVSRDSDFFYYIGRQYEVYDSIIDMKTGEPTLSKNPHIKDTFKKSERQIPQNVTFNWERVWKDNNINVEDCFMCGYGGRSIFVRKNTFSAFRCFRKVLYYRAEVKRNIIEMIPQYNKVSQGIQWEKVEVEPEEKIEDTDEIVEAAKLLGRDKQSQAGLISILADLVCELTDKSFMDVLREGFKAINSRKFVSFVENTVAECVSVNN